MLYETAFQAMEAPLMMLTGMFMAAAGLFFHMLRRIICAGAWLSLICDTLMGVVWAAIFLCGLTLANRGSLRLYHIFSAAAGAMLFHAAVSIPLTRICTRLCACARRTCGRICCNKFVKAILK